MASNMLDVLPAHEQLHRTNNKAQHNAGTPQHLFRTAIAATAAEG